jgi:AcrR family transcriptional regulator
MEALPTTDRPTGRLVGYACGMRDQIIEVARRLTLERGVVPSLNVVAAAAGVSKGGLIHHFPTRAALVAGLARRALDEVEAAMSAAVVRGDVAQTWLRLSAPSADERALLQGLAVGFRLDDPTSTTLLADARGALSRWEETIAAEVGDPVRARVIRLVGDALVANAVAGVEPEPHAVDELIRYLTSDQGRPG